MLLAIVNQTILAILHDWMQQAPNMAPNKN